MSSYRLKVSRFLNKIPGKKIFGVYRFLPIFFVSGAFLEFSMIHWHVGEVNFYRTYKKRVVNEAVEERLRKELNLN